MEKRFDGKITVNGLLFLKTKMADCNMIAYIDMSRSKCELCGIRQLDQLVDPNNQGSVDRKEIRDLMESLETGIYDVLIIRDILDLTTNTNDLEALANEILSMGIGIFEFSTSLYDITAMKDVSRRHEHLKSQVVDSGTVVFDGTGKWIQEFPTEEEAVEFIEEQ